MRNMLQGFIGEACKCGTYETLAVFHICSSNAVTLLNLESLYIKFPTSINILGKVSWSVLTINKTVPIIGKKPEVKHSFYIFQIYGGGQFYAG